MKETDSNCYLCYVTFGNNISSAIFFVPHAAQFKEQAGWMEGRQGVGLAKNHPLTLTKWFESLNWVLETSSSCFSCHTQTLSCQNWQKNRWNTLPGNIFADVFCNNIVQLGSNMSLLTRFAKKKKERKGNMTQVALHFTFPPNEFVVANYENNSPVTGLLTQQPELPFHTNHS